MTTAATATAGERAPTRLLVVDDDPDVGRLLEAVARAEGYPVARAASGREAIARADEADLVLLDYHLPDMTGLDALELIRRRGAAPAVVLVTAHGDEHVAAAALRAGADDYVVKDGSLVERLPQVLERARRMRALRVALAGAERELVRTERLAAIGEMMTTLHHEINNPLMAALAELELLAASGDPLTDGQRAGLAGIRLSLERIRDLLRRASELRRARSTEYLQGVRMIDLAPGEGPADAPAAPARAARGTAVLRIAEEDLARVTALLLRHAGFEVQRVARLDELRRAAGALGVRLVVVAGESPSAGGDPLGGFRPAPGRDYAVVALVGEGDGAAARAAGADHAIAVPFDPATFGAELLGAMETR